MTNPDLTSEFGRYRPRPLVAGLVFLAQRCPTTPVGRRLVRALQRMVSRRLTGQPVDHTVEGIRLRFYLHDNNSERKFLFTPRRSDPIERGLLARELPRDGVFVDVGANVGLYTLWACRHLGPDGRVIAFEPNPAAIARLRFNVAINERSPGAWPQLTLLPIGVGDEDGHRHLHLHPRNLGASSLIAGHPATEKIFVPCRPLLAVLEELGVHRIDVLKIDVEGAEDLALLPFLQGAGDRLLPRFLIVENSESLWHADLGTALRRRGYQAHVRTKMNTIYRLDTAAVQERAGTDVRMETSP